MRWRWTKINGVVQKFCGCYNNAYKMKKSGTTEVDIVVMAREIYRSDGDKKPFTLLHYWEILRDKPKWANQYETQSSSKRTKINASGKYEFNISVSMGGSGWLAKDIEDLSVLIKQADEQMYEQKREKKRKAAESSNNGNT